MEKTMTNVNYVSLRKLCFGVNLCYQNFHVVIIVGPNYNWILLWTNSRIQESREIYYYICATKKKIAYSKLREKSQNQKFAKI